MRTFFSLVLGAIACAPLAILACKGNKDATDAAPTATVAPTAAATGAVQPTATTAPLATASPTAQPGVRPAVKTDGGAAASDAGRVTDGAVLPAFALPEAGTT